MQEFYSLVSRFQALKDRTGASKPASYTVRTLFDPWRDQVTVEWGCFDVGDYPQHYVTTTTRGELLVHMAEEISKMEVAVATAWADHDPADLSATPWAIRFKGLAPSLYEEALAYAQTRGIGVRLAYTNDVGEWRWLVEAVDRPGLKLDVQPTQGGAEAVCKEMGWVIQSVQVRPVLVVPAKPPPAKSRKAV